MTAVQDGPDEALYHVSLLFKCVQREGQPDLLFIPSKLLYPSTVRLKITRSWGISKHRLWTTASDRVLWRTQHTLFNNSQFWWHGNMDMTCFTIDAQRMSGLEECVCVFVSDLPALNSVFLCLHLKQSHLQIGHTGLQDKVTLPGWLSWRKQPARTKQFRILLSLKLEHIEGLSIGLVK